MKSESIMRRVVVIGMMLVLSLGFISAESDNESDASYECRWNINGSNGKSHVCAEDFDKRKALARHIMDEHIEDDATSYTCQWKDDRAVVCDRKFNSVGFNNLSAHIKWHIENKFCKKKKVSDEFPFVCDWEKDGKKCAKGYRSSTLLDEHKNRHTGANPFVCKWVDEDGHECGTAYPNRSGLSRHRARKNHKIEQPIARKKSNKKQKKYASESEFSEEESEDSYDSEGTDSDTDEHVPQRKQPERNKKKVMVYKDESSDVEDDESEQTEESEHSVGKESVENADLSKDLEPSKEEQKSEEKTESGLDKIFFPEAIDRVCKNMTVEDFELVIMQDNRLRKMIRQELAKMRQQKEQANVCVHQLKQRAIEEASEAKPVMHKTNRKTKIKKPQEKAPETPKNPYQKTYYSNRVKWNDQHQEGVCVQEANVCFDEEADLDELAIWKQGTLFGKEVIQVRRGNQIIYQRKHLD